MVLFHDKHFYYNNFEPLSWNPTSAPLKQSIYCVLWSHVSCRCDVITNHSIVAFDVKVVEKLYFKSFNMAKFVKIDWFLELCYSLLGNRLFPESKCVILGGGINYSQWVNTLFKVGEYVIPSGGICYSEGNMLFQKGICYSQWGDMLFQKGIRYSQRGNVLFTVRKYVISSWEICYSQWGNMLFPAGKYV